MASEADFDRELVQRARGGDFAAFEQLVAKYERRLYTLASRIVRNRHDAEEIVQQTFVSVIEHLSDFRQDSSFYTWLTRIATNHALVLLRRRSTRTTVPLGDESREDVLPHPQYIAKWRETPEQIALQHETGRLLGEALDELDEKYRMVFLLRDIEGLSTTETAEALGITESNVKVRLLRARLMLRERLTHAFGDESKRIGPGEE